VRSQWSSRHKWKGTEWWWSGDERACQGEQAETVAVQRLGPLERTMLYQLYQGAQVTLPTPSPHPRNEGKWSLSTVRYPLQPTTAGLT
jgi:hypothetical protein